VRLNRRNKGFFQRRHLSRRAELGRVVASKHLPCVHQRNAIAAFGLIHEVGGNENGHALFARELHQQPPEGIARDRVNAGGGLIQDQ